MNAPVSTFPITEGSWKEVARIYRRICWLRASGRGGEAVRLQERDWAAAVAVARESLAAPDDGEAQLRAVQAAEEAQVTGAIAFAELLAPMLAQQLRASAISFGPESATSAPLVRAESRPTPTPATAALNIADFIDGMLEQDRTAGHLPAPPRDLPVPI